MDELERNDVEAVVLHLKLSDDEFGTFEEREIAFELEDVLEAAIKASNLGSYDGHEFGHGWCRFYAYGPVAEALAAAVMAALTARPLSSSSFLLIRFGPPGAREKRVELG